ncbi:MAG TPA: response regulator [Elusimicrobiales bacterium]|nr:response regulator [Elusimicrobiales bacterium]
MTDFDLTPLLDRLMGDAGMAAEVLAAFAADLPGQVAALEENFKKGDAEAVRRSGHRISGSAANVGADSLRDIAGEIEDACSAGGFSSVAALLPRLAAEAEQTLRRIGAHNIAASGARARAAGEKMRVLAVEDDPASRRILGGVLSKRGYETLTADTAAAALAAMQAAGGPDLVILDRMLPDGDGLDVCRKYRALPGAGMKYIILLTGKGAKQDVVDGLAAGANDYIVKPFDSEELLARVQVGARFIELHKALEAKIAELSAALLHVKRLQGLLPICMHCHKIRTDKASWERIESYISAHAEVRFSHGICPDCEKKYYPE